MKFEQRFLVHLHVYIPNSLIAYFGKMPLLYLEVEYRLGTFPGLKFYLTDLFFCGLTPPMRRDDITLTHHGSGDGKMSRVSGSGICMSHRSSWLQPRARNLWVLKYIPGTMHGVTDIGGSSGLHCTATLLQSAIAFATTNPEPAAALRGVSLG